LKNNPFRPRAVEEGHDMPTTMTKAIRSARRTAGLTQEQLGGRLGLKGRAIYRWERGDSTPSQRHRRALVTAIGAVNAKAAAALAAALAVEGKESSASAAEAQLAPAPALIDGKVALELAVFSMADELDLAPRRIRGSLLRLLKRLREANITFEAAQAQLEEWIRSAP
jgi:transcriptional regulator with XRE-family HTH domain